ncbi:EF-hand domain-containing family member C2 [Pipistrellus kuhlii]|uniref:EF-hand domain-containing family member C2 n=1 Tax=Pipistrellus kuhlii TaxID=59472 RepID=A0A7J7T1T4_PIPKU|nr:EF-hand domain-containing family member C2 [Pipistrellus kuhlii]KAF6294574.1 EF-hand domain containing 2 [Pipistrellus kuhlii]
MSLPMLPGYGFERYVGEDKYKRILVTEAKHGRRETLLHGPKTTPNYSSYPSALGSAVPSWVAFDKHVLSFDAYEEAEMDDKRIEDYRIRRYKIYFYLEDDTIQVNEPEIKNSGLPQGTSIRRHRIPLPPPNAEEFYTIHDFNINIDVVFYGRTFKIYDCNTFTKNFLKKVGVRLNPPGKCPDDPYTKLRKEILDYVRPLRPYDSFNTLKEFLEYDGKVLRFFCMWDDTASMFGDFRQLILHYFLADDTIEIKELLPHNSGRDPMSFFLQRGKLPKYGPPGVHQPGDVTDRIVLNVYNGYNVSRVHGYMLDKFKDSKLVQDFYKDTDLTIGASINVWGRKVLLCDCDEFTKTYYRTKYGIQNFPSIPCKPPTPPKRKKEFPPYTGFGSEEDSLRSCIGLVPIVRPDLEAFKKSMENDSYGNESNTLRFFAKMIKHQCEDADRLFVISYFLGNNTLSVFEPIERNSGYTGGLFLKRLRVKRPGQEIFKSELSEYIQPEELYIGARLNVNGYLFILLNADEYTLKYMEENSDRFPHSNLECALQMLKDEKSKAREIKQVFRAVDCNLTKTVDYNTFRNILMDITVDRLSEQQFITIVRRYGVPEKPCPNGTILLAMAHEQFRKIFYEDFDKLISYCEYEDRKHTKKLPSNDIRKLCKAARLPLTSELLQSLLSNFEDSEGQIDYKSFFSALNWRRNPVPELIPVSPLKERCEDVWLGMPSPIPFKCVNYFKFLEDVYGLDVE